LNHIGTQPLYTERLILRRFENGDAPMMFSNWANDSEVTKFLMWQPHESVEVSEFVIKGWIRQYEKKDCYNWAIVLKTLGEPIGNISVVNRNENADLLHVGYCIGKQWWGRGCTREAFSAVIDFLFEKVNVNKIESRHDPRNPNSGKVMEKCGLTFEGILRQSDFNNQGICDAAYYGILRNEWEERKEQR
jgi:ribosomal-protein-alanine N-acetyltransferase